VEGRNRQRFDLTQWRSLIGRRQLGILWFGTLLLVATGTLLLLSSGVARQSGAPQVSPRAVATSLADLDESAHTTVGTGQSAKPAVMRETPTAIRESTQSAGFVRYAGGTAIELTVGGHSEQVTLAGIEIPAGQSCSREMINVVLGELGLRRGTQISIQRSSTGGGDGTPALVWIEDESGRRLVNRELVRIGAVAVDVRNLPPAMLDEFLTLESGARAAGVGIWIECATATSAAVFTSTPTFPSFVSPTMSVGTMSTYTTPRFTSTPLRAPTSRPLQAPSATNSTQLMATATSRVTVASSTESPTGTITTLTTATPITYPISTDTTLRTNSPTRPEATTQTAEATTTNRVLTATVPPPPTMSNATSEATQAATVIASPSTGYDPYGPDRDCADFATQAQAQEFFIAAGGPDRDPHRLDGDNDGVACENLP
jgi:endonuclease YncB( thermonuclease family)